MSKMLILTNKDHHLFNDLNRLDHEVIDVDLLEDFTNLVGDDYEIVFDITTYFGEKKIGFLKDLSEHCHSTPLISDLSLCWGSSIIQTLPNMKGAISTIFYSPTSTYETFTESDHYRPFIQDLFNQLRIHPHWVNGPGLGFIYPRTISMIINEGYFAKEQDLALPEHMDLAMKFGVNYPLGPMEWSEKIGKKNIVALLDECFHVTSDSRYKVCELLRLESQTPEQQNSN